MGRAAADTLDLQTSCATVSATDVLPVPPVLLRAWLGRVQEALLRGVRLRVASRPQATMQLELLADDLDSVADQIRHALGLEAKPHTP
jgi:hypothetical protein